MSIISKFSFPTLIHFGVGARFKIAEHLKANNITNVLIVTDRGVAAQNFFKEFDKMLSSEKIKTTTFSEVWGNPVKSQVTEGVKIFKGSNAQGIIGLGGGAALDVAKAIALMSTHPGDIFDYEDEKPGAKAIDGKIPYWIAVPTTAGTGSEVGRSTVVSDDKTHIKKIIFSPKLLAQAVFADPELTIGIPAQITAATGMDALTHCIEAYFAKGYHPICEGIAIEGFRLAAKNLETATKNPTDIHARSQMLMSSMMGAIAFQKGLGVVHSCAHALSAVCNMHHGLANAVMIDHALKFNLTAIEDKFIHLSDELKLKDRSAISFLNWLTQLKQNLNIPARLSLAGVKKEDLPKLSELAFADACHPSNPKSVSHLDFVNIFNEAF